MIDIWEIKNREGVMTLYLHGTAADAKLAYKKLQPFAKEPMLADNPPYNYRIDLLNNDPDIIDKIKTAVEEVVKQSKKITPFFPANLESVLDPDNPPTIFRKKTDLETENFKVSRDPDISFRDESNGDQITSIDLGDGGLSIAPGDTMMMPLKEESAEPQDQENKSELHSDINNIFDLPPGGSEQAEAGDGPYDYPKDPTSEFEHNFDFPTESEKEESEHKDNGANYREEEIQRLLEKTMPGTRPSGNRAKISLEDILAAKTVMDVYADSGVTAEAKEGAEINKESAKVGEILENSDKTSFNIFEQNFKEDTSEKESGGEVIDPFDMIVSGGSLNEKKEPKEPAGEESPVQEADSMDEAAPATLQNVSAKTVDSNEQTIKNDSNKIISKTVEIVKKDKKKNVDNEKTFNNIKAEFIQEQISERFENKEDVSLKETKPEETGGKEECIVPALKPLNIAQAKDPKQTAGTEQASPPPVINGKPAAPQAPLIPPAPNREPKNKTEETLSREVEEMANEKPDLMPDDFNLEEDEIRKLLSKDPLPETDTVEDLTPQREETETKKPEVSEAETKNGENGEINMENQENRQEQEFNKESAPVKSAEDTQTKTMPPAPPAPPQNPSMPSVPVKAPLPSVASEQASLTEPAKVPPPPVAAEAEKTRTLPPPAPPVREPSSPSKTQHSFFGARKATTERSIDHSIELADREKHNWPLEVPLVPTYTFDSMVIGANRFAHATAISVIDNPGNLYNPLVLHGATGTGKTHFLNAIGYALSKKYGQQNIFLTNGVRFSRGIQRYVVEGKINTFEEFVKNTKAVLIDDIHLTAVNEQNREYISKYLNYFLQSNKQIVITSKYPPESLAKLEELINFKLDAGWISELKVATGSNHTRIVKKMLSDNHIDLTEAENEKFFRGMSLSVISRTIKRAKVLSHVLESEGKEVPSYPVLFEKLLAVSGEDVESAISVKDFSQITQMPNFGRGEWGKVGFFYPSDNANMMKWIAYSTAERAKEMGINGSFELALKSSYNTSNIISSAFKIANICDNKNLKGAVILGPSIDVCDPSVRENFYDILTHMLEIMLIRCGVINFEKIKAPSTYVKVIAELLK
ncbi:ATPase involved in DNA replication initiation [Elusimicrobium minutum Pei191]|uniref:Chromosomal replication initiator protein DnaA n=1 Tax=Elusimicrobium minutum (strain Pei191) TaxID=445932 RepID=B2KBN1_ELUMP|nr:DnaA/Hda family protein [Elusimicrobium minutum]ACC97718.1 ATPase involved in DNA replication initiation [Elusimicrobium minutum Pei191]